MNVVKDLTTFSKVQRMLHPDVEFTESELSRSFEALQELVSELNSLVESSMTPELEQGWADYKLEHTFPNVDDYLRTISESYN